MRGLYKRNGIYWARFKVRGHEYRLSLRTRTQANAERRMKALKQQIEDTAYFGASDPVAWESAVVSWANAWPRLGIKHRTGARYAQSLACCRRMTFCSPIPLRILAKTEGSRTQERAYHARFAAIRLHGEWFERTPEIEAEIERLKLAALTA